MYEMSRSPHSYREQHNNRRPASRDSRHRDDDDLYRKRRRSREREPRRRSTSRSSHYVEKRRRTYSRSPMSDRKRHIGDRTNPSQSRVLGVFGLGAHTTESHIKQIFSKFGPIETIQLVYDAKTGLSRGFCFVYYSSAEDAKVAKDQCSGMEINSHRIRVDYSITKRAHSPTPGVYMGRSTRGGDNREPPRMERRGERDRDLFANNRYRRRRSPSPQYKRRLTSRSYSPRDR